MWPQMRKENFKIKPSEPMHVHIMPEWHHAIISWCFGESESMTLALELRIKVGEWGTEGY